jgi:isoamylase
VSCCCEEAISYHDLATILGREPYGFDEGGRFLDSCLQDPVLSSIKLIAEPWDCGPGGYQVGGFPLSWAEWNDKFRDTVRANWKGDEGKLPDLAARLTASRCTILFPTTIKHNEANGENNQDGHLNNLSWNHGAENFGTRHLRPLLTHGSVIPNPLSPRAREGLGR